MIAHVGKLMQVPSGTVIIVITPGEWEEIKPSVQKEVAAWMPYDSSLIQMHIANCGYGIIDAEYGTAIDDEYLLDEIYEYIKKNF